MSGEQRRYVENIRLAADVLLEEINEILDYSKLESGRMTFENKNFNLRHLVDTLKAILENEAEQRNLTFVIEIDESVPEYVYGDPLKLKQVLTNLIYNGFKFTKEGGVKGVYLAANPDSVFWDELGAIKKRDGFKLMWEIESVWARPEFMDLILHAVQFADIFSINLAETQALFGCESDEDCIRGLRTLGVDMTLFRVGERGLYVVTKDEAVYLPPAPGSVVDTVGCGNSSTGGALYAYAEGKDPLTVGLMANIASARNLMQYGLIPEFRSIREECFWELEMLKARYK